jgi:CII-binding regulator of phage lambda lysogenization HflD
MTNKMTKREVINMMLLEETVKANETYVEYLNNELALLDKKTSNKKITKKQEQNENIKAIILETLSTINGTVTEIQSASAELSEFSNQKISALLRQLCASGEVVKTMDKKKAIFKLTENEVKS